MRFDISRLRHAIDKPAPTGKISNSVRPSTRPSNLPGNGRTAAVMLLVYVYTKHDDPRFVMTKRKDNLRDHPGQISLPGGRQQGGESLAQTAIRETVEEIGIFSQDIEIIGRLQQVYIPPSDFTIFPFVAWYHQAPKFRAQATEVESIIEADLAWLCRPESLQFGPITDQKSDLPLKSHFFEIETGQVWGATAKVLIDFRERLLAAKLT